MLLVKAKTKRKKIAEGQTVVYNISGRLLKYKKVNGIMKYVGVAIAAKKKVAKPKEKPVVGVKKMTVAQQKVFKDTGILCKDARTLKYVKDEMTSIFKAATVNIDYGKAPGYIKMIFYPSGSIRYTPNKIALNLDKMLEMDKKYGAKIFTGMPKAAKDAIMPFKKKLEKGYTNDEEIRKIKMEKRRLESLHNRTIDGTWRVKSALLKKYRDKYYVKWGNEHNIPFKEPADVRDSMLASERSTMDDAIPDILDTLYATEISATKMNLWEDARVNIQKVKDAKEITAVEKKQLVDTLKVSLAPSINLEEFKKKHKKELETYADQTLMKDIRSAVKKVVKADPKMEDWFEALYVAYYTNKILIPKMKKNPHLIKASEAHGIKDRESLRALFLKKRSLGFKTESSREKMLGMISAKGDEKITFSLKDVTSREKETIYRKMCDTFDKQEHHTFGFKIHNAFKIDDTSYYEEYKNIEAQKRNVEFSYHGTSFGNAAKIARGGFEIQRPDVGRMIGDGIYGSDTSSKSLQYVGEGFSRQIGTRGVLFVCKNALGQTKTLTDSELGRDSCNRLLQDKGYDTAYATKGTGGLRNNEWCCKNPKQFLPIYWIDVEIAQPGSYENY